MDTPRDTTPRDDQTTGQQGGVQGMLPLDLDPDEPVPFRLTPKARRAVAPHTLPTLEVVTPPSAPAAPAEVDPDHVVEVPQDLDDPHDPRSARARALRRGGMAVGDIARRLDVDELAVRTWTGDLDLTGRRRPRLRAVHDTHRSPASPAAEPTDERLARHHAAFARARREAADEAPGRLSDPSFVRGLALTVAAAEIDEHALLVSVRDRDVARTVRAWLVDHAGLDARDLRVVVRLGATAGADLVLQRWADALDLPPERLARTHWRSAPSEDAVEVLLRVPDAHVAARVAGWRDALLGTEDLGHLPTGVGF